VHPNGISYQWVIAPDVLSESPKWLLKLLRKQATQTLALDGVIKESLRNDQLFRLGCSLRSKGMSKNDFGMELHRINHYQCEPPLSDDEVNRIIDSVNLQLNQEKLPLFRYRDYLRSEQCPKDSTMRFILHAITFYMDENGDKGYPTEEQIASDTCYTRETVSRKLKQAVKDGHIFRRVHRQNGQKFFNYIYLLPNRFIQTPRTM